MRIKRPSRRHLPCLLLVPLLFHLLLVGGCKPEAKTETAASATQTNPPMKIRVGYIGLTCEAPIFMAVEKGFFKEQNLDVTLIKCDWSNYKDVMALGGYDITHHLVMYFLKPIEQGLDVKFTGGVHRGCLRVQAHTNSNVQTVEDLRGKRIGVPGMGTPPFIFANRVLKAHGIDPATEITWVVYPAGQLGLAAEKGDVDAIADAEPIGTLLMSQGNIKNIADLAQDDGYRDEYCCEVIVNGKFLANNPEAAAAGTRALLKAAKWVQANPAAAAKLSVEKKYLASNPELNTVAISHLNYLPSISEAEASVVSAAAAMKNSGMLSPSTDPTELAKAAFARLDGVSDQWLQSLTVETVAGGQLPPDANARLLAEIKSIGVSPVFFSDMSCCRLATQ